MSPKFPLCVPTASFVIRRKDDPYKVFIIRFRTKHGGGVGLPGGRVKFQAQGPREAAVLEIREELGMEIPEAELQTLTLRADHDRDVRPSISGAKYAHKDPIPSAVANLAPETFAAYHCNDTVYIGESDADPATLVPKDTVEVLRIELVDVRELPESMPISDDLLLLRRYCRMVDEGNDINTFPRALHDER